MSSTTPVPVVTIIQAVAFIPKEDTTNMANVIMQQILNSLSVNLVNTNIASTISKKVTDDITMKLVDHIVAAISPQATLVHDASQSLTSTLEDTKSLYSSIGREQIEKEDNIKTAADHIKDAADTLYESGEMYQKALHMLTPSLDATQEKIDQLSTQIAKTHTQIQGTAHLSCSTVAVTHLPPQVDQALGQAAIQACQILLDPLPGQTLFPPNTSNCNITTNSRTP